MHKYHGLAQFGFCHKITYEHILQLTQHNINIIDCEPTATKGVWLQALLEFGNHKGGQNLPFPFQDLAQQLSSSMNNVLCLDITCLTIQTT